VLAEAECRLQALVERWAEKGKSFKPDLAELRGAEELMAGPFMQHGTAQRLRKHLAKHYGARGERARQLKLLQARVDFAAAAYPCTSAAHAWALEAYADALLDAPEGLGDQGGQPGEALAAYDRALRTLTTMFGGGQEYVQAVEEKIARAARAARAG